MDLVQSVILGLVEGLTEYLPVSSTGHLILAQRALGIPDDEAAKAYAICIQAGAILAVMLLYHGRVKQAVLGVLGRDADGRRLAINLIVAFLPAAVIGLAFEHRIKDALFNLPSIAAAWLVGGAVILWVDRQRRGVDPATGGGLASLDWQRAFLIGLIQCLAMWPGTSRSLVTLLGGLMVGLSIGSAVEFSFLLGVVTLSAATAKDAWSHGAEMIQAFGWVNLAVGFVVATLSAAVAVRFMVSWLSRRGLGVFGWYRLALGAVVFTSLLTGCTSSSDGGTSDADAVTDAALEVPVDVGDPGTDMTCLVGPADQPAGCSRFQNVDGQGADSMVSAMEQCTGGVGTWQKGACPTTGATGECRQPGTAHFAQTDYCYEDPSNCGQTCLGTFTSY